MNQSEILMQLNHLNRIATALEALVGDEDTRELERRRKADDAYERGRRYERGRMDERMDQVRAAAMVRAEPYEQSVGRVAWQLEETPTDIRQVRVAPFKISGEPRPEVMGDSDLWSCECGTINIYSKRADCHVCHKPRPEKLSWRCACFGWNERTLTTCQHCGKAHP